MAWFELDPVSLSARRRPDDPASASAFAIRGIIGFTLLSVAGFAPWAVAGGWFHNTIGEIGMYIACALTFIGLSGPLLHRLILGHGSLSRFYKLFGIAFTAYSIAWIAGWMTLRGHTGGIIGLLAGTALMALIFTRAFDAGSKFVLVTAVLFLANSAGYFIGGVVEGALAKVNMLIAMLSWGVCYGIGFGAGLGLAFYFCQSAVLKTMATEKSNTPG
jgi:hypothetical protein